MYQLVCFKLTKATKVLSLSLTFPCNITDVLLARQSNHSCMAILLYYVHAVDFSMKLFFYLSYQAKLYAVLEVLFMIG